MQYNGFKRIRRVSALILSAALLVTGMPRTGTVYAAQEDGQEEQVQGQPEEEQPSTSDSGSGTTGTEAESESQTETEGAGETAPQTETEGGTEEESEVVAESDTGTETEQAGTREGAPAQIPVVDTRVFEHVPGEFLTHDISDNGSMYAQGVGALSLKEENGVYTLKNRDDFIEFINSSVDYDGKTVNLECDVDMDNEITGYPGTFKGTFDGKGHSIINLKTGGGLFKNIAVGATVKNLHISNASFDGSATAGIIASRNDGTVENCAVSGTLEMSSSMTAMAGIAVQNDGTVRNCVFSGRINAQSGSNIGGIVGRNQGTVEGCHTAGTIDTQAFAVAGVAAVNEETIKNSYNYMGVSGILSAAGIVAENNSGTVEGCINYGSVRLAETDDGEQVGGISAKNTGLVRKSQNYGSVSGAGNNAGGIAGATSGSIEECGNYGGIAGRANVAGIAGLYRGTQPKSIIKSYNNGTVSGNGLGIGGILGASEANNPVNVENCYNLGSISNSSTSDTAYSGGIAGVLKNGSISSCYNAGALPSMSSGSVAGFLSADESFKNSYFKEDSLNCIYYKADGAVPSDGSEYKKPEAELKSADIAAKLGDAYEAVSDGYPALKGQLSETYRYLVVYELNGGCSDKYFELVNKNGTVAKPDDPAKAHGTFRGWYGDRALVNQFDFAAGITAATTIYAKWENIVPVRSFAFKNTSATIPKGSTYDIEVSYTPQNAGNKTLTWTSSAPAVATVAVSGDNGRITAVSAGTAEIKAVIADGSLNIEQKFNVRVTDNANEIWIRDANLVENEENPDYGKDITSLDVTVNEPYAVEAVISGAIPGGATVVWGSSNTSVAEVAADSTAAVKKIAKITGKKPGEAKITVTFRQASASDSDVRTAVLDVTVRRLSTGVSIMLGERAVTEKTLYYDYATSKFVAVGSGEGNRLETPVSNLSAKVNPSDAGQRVEWNSGNRSVIEFADKYSGRFNAKSNGRAEITAKATDKASSAAKVTVEVRKIVSELSLEPAGLSAGAPVVFDKSGRVVLAGGQGIKIKPKYVPSDATEKGIRWDFKGSTEAISMAKNGSGEWVATANDVTKETEVTVTATALDLGPTGDGAKGSIKFIVRPKVKKINIYREGDTRNPVTNQNISVNPDDEGKTIGFMVKNEPENASQAVIWKSSDKKIATVRDNMDGSCVVTVKPTVGKADITAEAADGSGIKAKTTINVTIPVTGITITGSGTVMKGRTIQLSAKVEPVSAGNTRVTWESLAPEVATVDRENGTVTGIKVGDAIIRATAADGSGVKENHNIRVTAAIKGFSIIDGAAEPKDEKEAKDAELNGKAIGLDPDNNINERKLAMYITPKEACQTVDWKSSNEKVAKIDKYGTVTAVGLGKAEITAASTDGSGQKAGLTVNVTALAREISITGSHYVGAGKTIQLNAEVTNRDAAGKNVLWSSGRPDVIRVDQKGKVSVAAGKTTGEAEIKAEAADGSGIFKTHTVHIMGAKDTVEIVSRDSAYPVRKDDDNKKHIDIDMKDKEYVTVDLEAQLTGGTSVAGILKDVVWSSSNKKIAEIVKSDGATAQVRLYEKGNAVITAKTADGYESKDTCTIRVENSNPWVKITGPGQVGKNRKIQLSAGRTAIEEWSSTNTGVATVNAKGQVTAVGLGETTIKAKAQVGSNIGEYKIEVKEAVGKVDILSNAAETVSDKTLGLDILDGGLKLSAKTDVGATGDELSASVVWKSNKPSVASVDENGNVKPVKTGTAVITATATDGSGKRAKVTVIVAKQVTGIEPLQGEVRVADRKSVQLGVKCQPLTATVKKMSWKVAEGDRDYISVNSSGKVTAKRELAGSREFATVYASAADGSGKECSFKIYVTKPVNKVEVVEIKNAGAEEERTEEYRPVVGVALDGGVLKLGASLTARMGNEKLEGQKVAWKSSDTRVAKVDENGAVTGVKKGKAVITATATDGTGKSGKVTVYVGKLVTGLTLDQSVEQGITLNKGDVRKLEELVTVRPATATCPKLAFKSKDPKIATVSKNGVVKGIKKGGETTITISTTDGTNIMKEVKVKVN